MALCAWCLTPIKPFSLNLACYKELFYSLERGVSGSFHGILAHSSLRKGSMWNDNFALEVATCPPPWSKAKILISETGVRNQLFQTCIQKVKSLGMKAMLHFLFLNWNHSTSLCFSNLRNLSAACIVAHDLSADKALWNHITPFTNMSYIKAPLEYQEHCFLS